MIRSHLLLFARVCQDLEKDRATDRAQGQPVRQSYDSILAKCKIAGVVWEDLEILRRLAPMANTCCVSIVSSLWRCFDELVVVDSKILLRSQSIHSQM